MITMIKTLLKEIYDKYLPYVIMGVVILILSFLLMRTASNFKNYRNISDNNIEALTDSIEYYHGKNGELIAEKTLLIGDKKTLELANSELTDKLKSMKIKNAEQALIIRGYTENQQHDTTWVVTTDTTYVYPSFTKTFDFSNQYQLLAGDVFLNNNQLGLNITKNMVNFDYTVVVKDSKVYVTSDNPYVKYTEIAGITIPQYKPKFSFVVGPSVTVGYDPINKQFGTMVGVSATFGWNIFNVGKRLK